MRVLGEQQVQALCLLAQHALRDVVQEALGILHTAVRIAYGTRFVVDIPECTACGDDAVMLIPPGKGCGVEVALSPRMRWVSSGWTMSAKEILPFSRSSACAKP